jgi:hypothetical protein
VSITLWTLVRSRVLRVVIAAYPIAMALTLVYGGEHYVIDGLLGWLYVGLVLLIAVAWADRSTASGDPAREVTGADGVVVPDQHPVAIGAPGAIGNRRPAPEHRPDDE